MTHPKLPALNVQHKRTRTARTRTAGPQSPGPDFEFFTPEGAPRELREAASVLWPGRQVAWIIRVPTGSHLGEHLANVCQESVRTTEEVVKVALGTGHVLHVGLYTRIVPRLRGGRLHEHSLVDVKPYWQEDDCPLERVA